MKKNKPIRENLTPEELENYFSGPAYDYKRDFIRKLMREHPEAADPFVIGSATEEMLDAAESGVLLSTDDALRLVEYKVPMTTEEAVRQLRDNYRNENQQAPEKLIPAHPLMEQHRAEKHSKHRLKTHYQ